MITLLIAAALGGGCRQAPAYGYSQPSYYRAATYTYAAPTYAAPVQQYQAPAYNQSLVGDYMRQESAYQAQVQQNAKLDVLLKLLTDRATPPPQPQVQQYSAPAPQPQYYGTPQQPSKSPPVEQYQSPPSPQYQAPPSPQYAPSDQPPYATKPQPSSPPSSFESSSWRPPASSPGGGVAAMTSLIQNRCAQCHVGTSERGGGVKLLELDGSLAQIDSQLEGIAKAVSSGRMPKAGGRLNPQELQTIFAGLDDYVATSRARQNVVASFGQ
jgi:mono/diheme cytochrome c family protein